MTNVLALAARLRAMDDDAIRTLLGERAVSPTGVDDFFDLAEALLDRDSIQRALSQLDRQTLAVIAAVVSFDEPIPPAEVVTRLIGWGMAPAPSETSIAQNLHRGIELLLVDRADETVAGYDAVREHLRSWPTQNLPSGIELAASPPPVALAAVPAVDTDLTDRLAAEHAFAAVAAVSELIAELTREPARELQKGGLALPAAKRLAAAMATDLAEVAGVLSVAARAGLAARDGASWFATDAGAGWQLRSTAERWATLAAAWIDALPADVRSILGSRAHAAWGDGLHDFVVWAYPAGGARMQQRVSDYVRDAEVLGITAQQAPSSPGVLLLERGTDEAMAAIGGLFPSEVEQVYLQHDLSIVSPGPLAPTVDSRLRRVADVESRALASTYRISAASINRAIAAGESAGELREFLAGISLTGIPQPLEYLIAETAERYGRVRVGEVASASSSAPEIAHEEDRTARSYVHSEDAELLGTIEVDQELSSLGLVRTAPDRLVSRFSRDVVFWALSDARYPVAAEDAGRNPVTLRRHRAIVPPAAERIDPISALIERLRVGEASAGPDTDAAWLARQLDIAIRARVALLVSVALPEGRVLEYLLEPTGIGGGRLRGRDRLADIERTLPLSSIQGIRPAE